MRHTATCLINNFNYASYVVEAVESVLAQTRPFDEIIVVDDGSTDDSVERLRPLADSGHIRLITKPNEGQLSCFNEGFAASSGDVVTFLDADDVYDPRYLEHLMRVYETHDDCDFVFAALRQFDEPPPSEAAPPPRDLGYSVVLTVCRRAWIGAPTSCLSLRRSLLQRILPLPFLEDWRTRADDCLVFGASVLGGKKYQLDYPLVRYRYHGENQFARRKYSTSDVYRRRLALNRLFDHLVRSGGWDRASLAELAHREFQTLPRPSFRQWGDYARISLSRHVRWSRKLALLASITGYYLLGLQK